MLELEWSDLVPEQEKIEDPFATMPLEQLDNLGAVVYVRDLRAADLPVTDADVEAANQARAELKQCPFPSPAAASRSTSSKTA